MKWLSKLIVIFVALFVFFLPASASALERPVIKGEQFYVSGKPFVPFGYFYMQDEEEASFIQDYLRSPSEEKAHLLENFAEARELYHANTMRIFLDMPLLMQKRGVLNKTALAAVRDMLREGEKLGLYFVLTSNTHTEPETRLAWYDKLSRKERWDVQARYWELLARALKTESNIVWYELANEPTVGHERGQGWYHGNLGGFYWAQHIAFSNNTKERERLAREWIIKMKGAVEAGDKRAIVGAGLLPWTNRGNAFNVFNIANLLDVYPVHIYPSDEDLAWSVQVFSDWNREVKGPVVVGEVFTLNGGQETIANFLTSVKKDTSGYLSFYNGAPIDSGYNYPGQILSEANIEVFSSLAGFLKKR